MGTLIPLRGTNFVKFGVFVAVFVTLISASVAQVLPDDEVQTLRAIASRLAISSRLGIGNNWTTIGPNSCMDNATALSTTFVDRLVLTNVTCDCTYNNSTVCHITNIVLQGLNLTGPLPVEFANLTFLTEIDLTRNLISGMLPSALAQLPSLRNLSLSVNRVSGIPAEIGNIATLQELELESNLLRGNLPPFLGGMSNLSRLLLSGNNFNGTIPESYGNLRNLTDFRIDGNELSGRIPDFIGNWTRLERLDMQGTSLTGPIPDSISLLANMNSLIISDLNVSSMFPNLQTITTLVTLVMRNCSLTGIIPAYIGNMPRLQRLDLSFNRLNGDIPRTFQQLLRNQVYMFLSHNSLTGVVPDWLDTGRSYIDLSYNNFTQTPVRFSCQGSEFLNLVASHSPSISNSGENWCLRQDLRCPDNANRHTLHINCGGTGVNNKGTNYSDDSTNGGPSYLRVHSDSTTPIWGYSSSGLFVGSDRAPFTARNMSAIVSTDEIDQTARLAPSSLKYYGLCLRQGSYTVRLYFAEIMFTNDSTFSSLGRRQFDVAIQGVVVLRGFNIAREANGFGIGIFREFDNVTVNGSTLEIHLYWTGKGTNSIPRRPTYGPLISAISITPNFDVSTGGLSVGAIVGIVIASSVVVILVILLILWWIGCFKGKSAEELELRAMDLQLGYFSIRQMKAATNNFDVANKIGEGGFGPVYKGVLSDGTVIAVKALSAKSRQGNREFVNEIGMISALQHPNLVKLYGCCIEANQLLLIYEYLENNCLARALFGRPEQLLHLNWATRKKICIDIAKGLAYLHEESRLKIVHRDIKATNVLLDKDLNAKISDFGLAKLDEEENTHISTRIAGTIGYMAPEYAMRGYLTDKADVYSFGIVLLEVVSGKSNTNYRPKEEFVYLLDWAYVLEEQGKLLDLVDPALGSDFKKKEASRMLNLALMCANPSPTLRPAMSAVVSMLEGKVAVQVPVYNRGGGGEEMRLKAYNLISEDSHSRVSEALSQDTMEQKGVDGPWVDSNVSVESKDEHWNDSSTSRLL